MQYVRYGEDSANGREGEVRGLAAAENADRRFPLAIRTGIPYLFLFHSEHLLLKYGTGNVPGGKKTPNW